MKTIGFVCSWCWEGYPTVEVFTTHRESGTCYQTQQVKKATGDLKPVTVWI